VVVCYERTRGKRATEGDQGSGGGASSTESGVNDMKQGLPHRKHGRRVEAWDKVQVDDDEHGGYQGYLVLSLESDVTSQRW
jgi:hypothetical protein